MGEYMQFSAKTKNEAITKACIELGVSSDQLDIQVVSEGSSGFFGIGSKPAIIKARKVEESSEEKEIEKIIDSVKIDALKEETAKEVQKPAVKSVSKTPETKKESGGEKAKEERQPKPVREKQFREKASKEKPVREQKENLQKKNGKSCKGNRDHYRSGRNQRYRRESTCIPERCICFHGSRRSNHHFQIQHNRRLSGS